MTDDVPRSRPLLALLVIAAAPVTVMLTYFLVRNTLPDRVPDGPGWFASGSPERPVVVAGLPAAVALMEVVIIAILYVGGYKRAEGRSWLATAAYARLGMAGVQVARL